MSTFAQDMEKFLPNLIGFESHVNINSRRHRRPSTNQSSL